MRCAACGWPVAEAEVISTHLTSEGVVRYRRCPCGRVSVELAAPVAAPPATPVAAVGGWSATPTSR